MRALTLLGLLAVAVPQTTAPAKSVGCDPLGNVRFICGLVGPEDLVRCENGRGQIFEK